MASWISVFSVEVLIFLHAVSRDKCALISYIYEYRQICIEFLVREPNAVLLTTSEFLENRSAESGTSRVRK